MAPQEGVHHAGLPSGERPIPPKLYLFIDSDRYALFVGSSNLTYSGFYANFESNVLIEGILSNDAADVRELQVLLEKWRSSEFSFKPNKKWLDDYREDHKRDRDAQRKARIKTEASEEENFGSNWLEKADWQTYHQKVIEGMKKNRRDMAGLHNVLDAAAQHLSLPWKTSYFRDPEKRWLIGGVKRYGPMGHVFAAGSFAHLVARQKRDWGALVNAVNQIAKLEPPIQWGELESRLRQLVGLGNTMKVWGESWLLSALDDTVAFRQLRFAKSLRRPSMYRRDVSKKLTATLH